MVALSHAANKSRLIDFLGYFVIFFVIVDENSPIMERDINQPNGKILTLFGFLLLYE